MLAGIEPTIFRLLVRHATSRAYPVYKHLLKTTKNYNCIHGQKNGLWHCYYHFSHCWSAFYRTGCWEIGVVICGMIAVTWFDASPIRVILVWLLTTPDHTGQDRTAPGPYRAGNDWSFRFDDKLKGVRQANYPQLTEEMNASRNSWWVYDGRIQCFLLIQSKPKHQAPGING